VRSRIAELASGRCLCEYVWDGGGSGWSDSLPTDADLLVHLFATYLDLVAPPSGGGAAAKPPAAAAGSSLFGSAFGAPPGGSLFGGSSLLGAAPRPAAGSSLFGAAPAPAAAAASPALGEGAVFWRSPEAHDGFSRSHFALASESQRRRSDAVLLRQPGAPGSPPIFSLLVGGAEWTVGEGEHNAPDALVLFLLQRAKSGGHVGGANLAEQTYTLWLEALSAAGAAVPPRPESPLAFHALLSTLHPWSAQLESLSLAAVTKELDR